MWAFLLATARKLCSVYKIMYMYYFIYMYVYNMYIVFFLMLVVNVWRRLCNANALPVHRAHTPPPPLANIFSPVRHNEYQHHIYAHIEYSRPTKCVCDVCDVLCIPRRRRRYSRILFIYMMQCVCICTKTHRPRECYWSNQLMYKIMPQYLPPMCSGSYPLKTSDLLKKKKIVKQPYSHTFI